MNAPQAKNLDSYNWVFDELNEILISYYHTNITPKICILPKKRTLTILLFNTLYSNISIKLFFLLAFSEYMNYKSVNRKDFQML